MAERNAVETPTEEEDRGVPCEGRRHSREENAASAKGGGVGVVVVVVRKEEEEEGEEEKSRKSVPFESACTTHSNRRNPDAIEAIEWGPSALSSPSFFAFSSPSTASLPGPAGHSSRRLAFPRREREDGGAGRI